MKQWEMSEAVFSLITPLPILDSECERPFTGRMAKFQQQQQPSAVLKCLTVIEMLWAGKWTAGLTVAALVSQSRHQAQTSPVTNMPLNKALKLGDCTGAHSPQNTLPCACFWCQWIFKEDFKRTTCQKKRCSTEYSRPVDIINTKGTIYTRKRRKTSSLVMSTSSIFHHRPVLSQPSS